MAAVEIIAVGTTLLNSGDQVATPGMEIALKTSTGRNTSNNVGVLVLAKTTLGYAQVAVLNAANPTYIFNSNVIFQVERPASSDSVGVDIVGAGNLGSAGNVDTGALVTLTAAAVGGNSADQVNSNGRGLQVGINITAATGTTPVLVVTVQGKDTASGTYYNLLVSANIVAAGFTLLTVYPAAPATANVSTPQVLPRTYRVLYTITGTTPAFTGTIGASVIV